MRAILVDTNMLILLVVGLTSPARIATHKRLRSKSYEVADFAILTALVRQYDAIARTSHVLAETSNLAAQVSEPLRTAIRRRLGALAIEIAEHEHAPRAADVVRNPLYLRLGLTDAAIATLTDRVSAIVTDDLDLYLALSAQAAAGVEIFYFTYLRDLA